MLIFQKNSKYIVDLTVAIQVSKKEYVYRYLKITGFYFSKDIVRNNNFIISGFCKYLHLSSTDYIL